jgi:hypothetical protein
MEIDKDHIVTQEETGEPALIEVADEAAGKKMRELEEEAKRSVEEGLDEQD